MRLISPSLRRASLLPPECAITPPACRGATLCVVAQRSPPIAGASAAIAARCFINMASCNRPLDTPQNFRLTLKCKPRHRNAGFYLCRVARFARSPETEALLPLETEELFAQRVFVFLLCSLYLAANVVFGKVRSLPFIDFGYRVVDRRQRLFLLDRRYPFF